MAVDLHDVPEDRLLADLDQRLRHALGLLAQAGSHAARRGSRRASARAGSAGCHRVPHAGAIVPVGVGALRVRVDDHPDRRRSEVARDGRAARSSTRAWSSRSARPRRRRRPGRGSASRRRPPTSAGCRRRPGRSCRDHLEHRLHPLGVEQLGRVRGRLPGEEDVRRPPRRAAVDRDPRTRPTRRRSATAPSRPAARSGPGVPLAPSLAAQHRPAHVRLDQQHPGPRRGFHPRQIPDHGGLPLPRVRRGDEDRGGVPRP